MWLKKKNKDKKDENIVFAVLYHGRAVHQCLKEKCMPVLIKNTA